VVAVVARPTLSRGLWRQMVGRVLRTYDGTRDGVRVSSPKLRALVLDHGGNAVRHGHIYAPDPATLEQSAHRLRDTDPPATSVCPSCFGVYWRTEDRTCPYCGVERPVKEREIRRVEGDLERVDWSAAPLAGHTDTKATAAARALAERARERGYARGWLFWQLKLRYGVDRARALMKECAA
jgi:superfamily II DNA or RNA helicase